jgi:hypothetical protein
MDQRSPVTRYSQGVFVCTTVSLALGPLSGAAKTPLGPDQVNVLLLFSNLNGHAGEAEEESSEEQVAPRRGPRGVAMAICPIRSTDRCTSPEVG